VSRAIKVVTGREDNIEVRIKRPEEIQMVHTPVLDTAQDAVALTLPLSRRPIPACPFVRLGVAPAEVLELAGVRVGCWREVLAEAKAKIGGGK
jgi:hypothetical protein